MSATVLGYNTECDKRSPSVEGGGSDPYLHGRYSANGPSIETRWGIGLYLMGYLLFMAMFYKPAGALFFIFTTHPSSRESFSANGH